MLYNSTTIKNIKATKKGKKKKAEIIFMLGINVSYVTLYLLKYNW